MDALKQNKKFILLGCAVLAFILLAFAPAVDVLGKGTLSGFKYIFEADGAGFTRFMMLLCLLAPLAACYFVFMVPQEKQGKNPLYCFAGAAILGLLTLICLPTGLSFAWGGWLFIVLTAAGAAVSYFTSQN